MSTPTLHGTVRVIAKGPFEGQVGVIWDYDSATRMYYVRIGNDKPLLFFSGELTQVQAEDTLKP